MLILVLFWILLFDKLFLYIEVGMLLNGVYGNEDEWGVLNWFILFINSFWNSFLNFFKVLFFCVLSYVKVYYYIINYYCI